MTGSAYNINAAKDRPKNPPTIITETFRYPNGVWAPVCGTKQGYGRHIRAGEKACYECSVAYAKGRAEEEGREYTGRRHRTYIHGTWSAVGLHKKLGEKLCYECSDHVYQEGRKHLKTKAAFSNRYALEQRLKKGYFLIRYKPGVEGMEEHFRNRPPVRPNILNKVLDGLIPDEEDLR